MWVPVHHNGSMKGQIYALLLLNLICCCLPSWCMPPNYWYSDSTIGNINQFCRHLESRIDGDASIQRSMQSLSSPVRFFIPSAQPFTSRCLIHLKDYTTDLRAEDRDENAVKQIAQHEQLKSSIRSLVSTEKIPDKAIYDRGLMID